MPASVTPAAVGDPARPRKRRPWLLLPAVGLAVFLAASSAGWLYARARIGGAIDTQAEALRRAGWTVRLEGRRWDGFPFRLKLSQAVATVVSPSGWGLDAPGLTAEAVIFDPTHWVYAAPQGLDLHRGSAGVVRVRGRSLAASTAGMAGAVWRVALVGEGLALEPAPGARPTAFTRMERWEAYMRPATDGMGDAEVLWRLSGGAPTPHQLVWRFAPAGPVDAVLTGRFTRVAAFRGAGWGAEARSWAAAGGAFHLQTLAAHGGGAEMRAEGGALTLDPAGRLAGAVSLRIRQQPGPGGEALAPPGSGPGAEEGRGVTRLVFGGGEARLGGLRLGPAPEVAR